MRKKSLFYSSFTYFKVTKSFLTASGSQSWLIRKPDYKSCTLLQKQETKYYSAGSQESAFTLVFYAFRLLFCQNYISSIHFGVAKNSKDLLFHLNSCQIKVFLKIFYVSGELQHMAAEGNNQSFNKYGKNATLRAQKRRNIKTF